LARLRGARSGRADSPGTCTLKQGQTRLTILQTQQAPWGLRIHPRTFASADGFDRIEQVPPHVHLSDATHITLDNHPVAANLVIDAEQTSETTYRLQGTISQPAKHGERFAGTVTCSQSQP